MLHENTSHPPDLIARIVRIAFAAALLWAVVRLLGYLGDVLIPFAVALLLAYLADPLVRLAQRKIPNRFAAVFLCLLGLVCLTVLVAWLLVPAVVREMADLGRLLSRLAEDANLANRAASVLPPDLWREIKSYASEEEGAGISSVRGQLAHGGDRLAQDTARSLGGCLRPGRLCGGPGRSGGGGTVLRVPAAGLPQGAGRLERVGSSGPPGPGGGFLRASSTRP